MQSKREAIRELQETVQAQREFIVELRDSLQAQLSKIEDDLKVLRSKTEGRVTLPGDSRELVNELNGRVGRVLDFYHQINKRLMNVEAKMGVQTTIGGLQNEIVLKKEQ